MIETPNDDKASEPLSTRLIRFESPDQIRERPLWRDELDPAKHQPIKILGGYTFPVASYMPCGITTCRTMHGSGYVVGTNGNTETNIGKDCGERLFGQQFAEIERLFQKEETAQIRRDLLAKIVRERNELLVSAKAAFAATELNLSRIQAITNEIGRDPKLQKAFDDAIRNGGALFFERAMTERERDLNPGQHFIRERAGRIDGLKALDYPKLAKQLKYEVIGPLHDLTEESLASAKGSVLDNKYELVGRLRNQLREADELTAETARLCQVKNWTAFQAVFRVGQEALSDRGHRVLARLVQMHEKT